MGIPQTWHPNFSRALVLSDIFNRLNFEYSELCSLKVDSLRRIRKKKKQAKRKKIVFTSE